MCFYKRTSLRSAQKTTTTVTENIADIQNHFSAVLAEKDKQISKSKEDIVRLKSSNVGLKSSNEMIMKVAEEAKKIIMDKTAIIEEKELFLSKKNGEQKSSDALVVSDLKARLNAVQAQRVDLKTTLAAKQQQLDDELLKAKKAEAKLSNNDKKHDQLLRQYSQKLKEGEMQLSSMSEELSVTKHLALENVKEKDIAMDARDRAVLQHSATVAELKDLNGEIAQEREAHEKELLDKEAEIAQERKAHDKELLEKEDEIAQDLSAHERELLEKEAEADMTLQNAVQNAVLRERETSEVSERVEDEIARKTKLTTSARRKF